MMEKTHQWLEGYQHGREEVLPLVDEALAALKALQNGLKELRDTHLTAFQKEIVDRMEEQFK